MKIISIEPSYSEIIETDDEYGYYYRRFSKDRWEKLYGEYWESCYSEEETLERLYQEFKNGSI